MYGYWARGMGQYAPPDDPPSPLGGEEVFILTEGILDDGKVLGVYSSLIRAKAAIGGAGWIDLGEGVWCCPGQVSWTLQATRCKIDQPHRERPLVYRPSPPVFTSSLTRDPEALAGGPSAETREEADSIVDKAFRPGAQVALIYPCQG